MNASPRVLLTAADTALCDCGWRRVIGQEAEHISCDPSSARPIGLERVTPVARP